MSRPSVSREVPRTMYHYTDQAGYNSIRSGVDWIFKAHQPPPRDSDHPRAAYFTTLPPGTKNLSPRISVPKVKLAYVFAFQDAGDLTPLRGGRGIYVLFSTTDYVVPVARQLTEPTGPVEEVLA